MADETKVTNASSDNAGLAIRAAVLALAAMLLGRGVISKELYDQIEQILAGLVVVIPVLIMIGTIAQSVYAKWKGRNRTETLVKEALDAPAGTTKAELVAANPPEPSLIAKVTGSGSTPLPTLVAVALAGLLSAGILLVSSACGTFGGDKPITVNSTITQANAKRALIELQDARTLVLKSMATIYMTSPNDPNVIASVRAVDRYDAKFREAWQLAALAADAWSPDLFSLRYGEAHAQVDAMKAEVAK